MNMFYLHLVRSSVCYEDYDFNIVQHYTFVLKRHSLIHNATCDTGCIIILGLATDLNQLVGKELLELPSNLTEIDENEPTTNSISASSVPSYH